MSSKKVVVAMSGGVDSSVCAALLLEQGLSVIGVTMRLGLPSDKQGRPAGPLINRAGRPACPLISRAGRQAKKAAQKLGIPHYIWDLRGLFREKVIADFCAEYEAGRTPNPCIRCNRYIKFGALLEKARQLGADYIATGHYARIEYDGRRRQYLLKKGLDARKDQSYFLYTLGQKQLRHTLLPLGGFTKERVRAIAQEKGLPQAKGPESQDTCFIPDIPQARLPGPIVNKKGEVLGEHKGIIFYTIGQRKGIGIAAKQPLYVTSIDKDNNTIVVGKKDELLCDELLADNIHFIYLKKLKAPLKVEAKIRSLHPPACATVTPVNKGKVKVRFDRPQWAVTPGQAVVFCRGDIVLGGGRISS